jgi:hypothetical protein
MGEDGKAWEILGDFLKESHAQLEVLEDSPV